VREIRSRVYSVLQIKKTYLFSIHCVNAILEIALVIDRCHKSFTACLLGVSSFFKWLYSFVDLDLNYAY
jgi:hypothetical protein